MEIRWYCVFIGSFFAVLLAVFLVWVLFVAVPEQTCNLKWDSRLFLSGKNMGSLWIFDFCKKIVRLKIGLHQYEDGFKTLKLKYWLMFLSESLLHNRYVHAQGLWPFFSMLDTSLQVSPSQRLSGGLVQISNMILEIGHAKQGVKNIFSGKH